MPLLPPERSDICMAPGASVLAQSAAGAGVGAAASALADGAASLAAGAEAACDSAAFEGTADDAVELHAANSRTATIARLGNVRCLLIPCSSQTSPGVSGSPILPSATLGGVRLPRPQSSAYSRFHYFFS